MKRSDAALMKANPSSYLQDIFECCVADALPNEFHITHHEMFNENVVHARAGRQQIWQIWQFLDDNDAIVHGGLQQGGDRIRDQDGNHDGHGVRNLAGHLECDDADRHGVCHSTRKCSRTDQSVAA